MVAAETSQHGHRCVCDSWTDSQHSEAGQMPEISIYQKSNKIQLDPFLDKKTSLYSVFSTMIGPSKNSTGFLRRRLINLVIAVNERINISGIWIKH